MRCESADFYLALISYSSLISCTANHTILANLSWPSGQPINLGDRICDGTFLGQAPAIPLRARDAWPGQAGPDRGYRQRCPSSHQIDDHPLRATRWLAQVRLGRRTCVRGDRGHSNRLSPGYPWSDVAPRCTGTTPGKSKARSSHQVDRSGAPQPWCEAWR